MGFNPFCQHLLWSIAFLASLGSLWLTTPDEGESADYWSRATARVMFLWWTLAMVRFLWPGLNSRTTRLVWTFAFVAFAVHFVTALGKYHHWSHSSAYQHVEGTSGFGPGIFVSYAFTLLWLIEVLWWWVDATSYEKRPAWLKCSILCFIAFIVFNGTVVYESGQIRWIGISVFTLLAIVLRKRLHYEKGKLTSLPCG